MTCVTKQHVGKYTYYYESSSYRDENGKVRNKKKKIGTLNMKTNEVDYLPEYLSEHPELQSSFNVIDGKSVQAKQDTSPHDNILNHLDNVKIFGVYWFFKSIAEKIGLIPILQSVFPTIWQDIFALSCYLIASDKPVMYCDDWQSENIYFDESILTSQRISDLLTMFSFGERCSFYRQWSRLINSKEYIALDITSVSSYSENIKDCEWGYNRDGDKLKQINICLLFGQTSRLPVYQTEYSGSLKDISTLKTTLNEFSNLIGQSETMFVMDKGFYSINNIAHLVKDFKFIVNIPFTCKFVKELINSSRDSIDNPENIIFTNSAAIRGIHKVVPLCNRGKEVKIDGNAVKMKAHIYFDIERYYKERNELFEQVARAKLIAETDPDNKEYKKYIKSFLKVSKIRKGKNHNVTINHDACDKHIEFCGWWVLLSNNSDTTQEAYNIYRMKDVVEKSFWKYKNSLELDRLRVHSDERMENKIFVSFIALILASHIHNVMRVKDMYKQMSFDRVFTILAKIKSVTIDGNIFLRLLTKQQKDLLDDFDLSYPTSPVG
jgi:transposase